MLLHVGLAVAALLFVSGLGAWLYARRVAGPDAAGRQRAVLDDFGDGAIWDMVQRAATPPIASPTTRRGFLSRLAVGGLIVVAGGRPARGETDTYTFTIYVDDSHETYMKLPGQEGEHIGIGHVFVAFSKNGAASYYGFYPSVRNTPAAPGKIANDYAHPYDACKTWTISERQFLAGLQGVKEWRAADPWYRLDDRHCGDFAEQMANRVGIRLHVPGSLNRTRPHNFFQELGRTGGEVRSGRAGQGVAPPPRPHLDTPHTDHWDSHR